MVHGPRQGAKTNSGPPMNVATIHFIPAPAITGREEKYIDVTVDAPAVIKEWKLSLLSFEWLLPDGTIRTIDELPIQQREKRLSVESRLNGGKPLEKPVLGIGLMDNIEIGSGKDVFLTLAALGYRHIPVHILKSCEKDFAAFRTR